MRRRVFIPSTTRVAALFTWGQTGGQIRRQTNTLWSEMKVAFNRKPNEIQKLYRIDHRPNARAKEKKTGTKAGSVT